MFNVLATYLILAIKDVSANRNFLSSQKRSFSVPARFDVSFNEFYRPVTNAPSSSRHVFIERSINFHKSASRAYANDDPDDPSRLTDKSRLDDSEVRATGSTAARRATNPS